MVININKINGEILDLDPIDIEVTGSMVESAGGLLASNNFSEIPNKTTALNNINGVSTTGLHKGSVYVGTTTNTLSVVTPPSVSDNVKYYLQELNGVASFDTISGGLSSVITNSTLNGNGTSISPLGIAPLEPRHYVGATGQPTFQNGWNNVGSPYPLAAFYMDNQGIVHLEGLIKSGTIGQIVFILPFGYIPTLDLHFVVNSNNAFGAININNSGTVDVTVGSNVWVALDGITFRP